MSGYPTELITNYRAGKISRQQFTEQFSDWQKSHGINYDCKGTADKNSAYLEYRGIQAKIENGFIFWGDNLFACYSRTLFEFERQVDHVIYARLQLIKKRGALWN